MIHGLAASLFAVIFAASIVIDARHGYGPDGRDTTRGAQPGHEASRSLAADSCPSRLVAQGWAFGILPVQF